MTPRTVVYDAGMLLALLRGDPRALLFHRNLRAAPHRPVIIGPVLAQTWRPDPKTAHAFSRYLRDCAVPQARDGAPHRATTDSAPCIACEGTFTVDSYKRVGAMLAEARLPAKKRPDVVDALVVLTAARHGPAQVVTSDPDDIAAYAATLDQADLAIKHI